MHIYPKEQRFIRRNAHENTTFRREDNVGIQS